MDRAFLVVALVALCIARTWAQTPGERLGLLVKEGGVTADQEVNVFDFDANDFDLTCSGGACAVAVGPHVVVSDGRAGGQTIMGGTAASQNLTLQSTSTGARGQIVANDTIKVLPTDHLIGTADEHGMLMNNAYTVNGSSAFVHAIFQNGSFTYTAGPAAAHPHVLIESGQDNIAAAHIEMFQPYLLANPQTMQVNNGFSWSMGDAAGTIYDLPIFKRVGTGQFLVDNTICVGLDNPNTCCTGAGTGACTSVYTFLRSQFQLEGGATVNTRRGFAFDDAQDGAGGGSGTVQNQIVLRAADLTKGTVSNQFLLSEGAAVYSRHAGPFRIGDTTVPTEKLEVAGNALVTGTTYLRTVVATDPGAYSAAVFNPSYSLTATANATTAISLAPTVTITATAGAVNTEKYLSANPIYEANSVPALTTFAMFEAVPIINFNLASAATTWSHTVYSDTSGLEAENVAAGTLPQYKSYSGSPRITANGASGSITAPVTIFDAAGRATTGIAGATATISTLKHFNVTAGVESGGGTEDIQTEIGLDVPAMTAATTRIGVRNADTTVYTPSTAQTISAVGNTILCNATVVQITNGSAVGPLTSAPQIADGQNGQVCTIINTGAGAITLESTFATGGIRLGAADLALGTQDTITLVYNATLGDWIRIASADN